MPRSHFLKQSEKTRRLNKTLRLFRLSTAISGKR
jgi:hypothetical protein